MSAAPMGMPGWPLLACWTASAESMRMVLTAFWTSSGLALGTSFSGKTGRGSAAA